MPSPIIAANDTGTGPNVVILHGLLGSGRNWGGVARDLSVDHHVWTPDLPNHGGSGWIDRMDYRTQAGIVAQWIETRIGGAVTLLGHSMGGKIAMTLALTRADLVNALIVADIAPVSYDHDFGAFTKAMKQVPVADMTTRKQVEDLLAERITDPRNRAFLLQNLKSTPQGFRWRSNLDVIERSEKDILGFPNFPNGTVYNGSALFISGGRSDYVLSGHGGAIEALFPHSDLVQLPDAGHWLHADCPQEFLTAVRNFLSKASS